MSPVRSHSSVSIVCAVASGRLRSPFIICGPRTQTSPSWFGPNDSPVSKSTILHSVLGAGTPTDPNLTFAGSAGEECVTGLVSVITRSEEHTSELQSRSDLVCRLLLEKKKKKNKSIYTRC